MNTDDKIKRLRQRRLHGKTDTQPDGGAFLTLLNEHVVERFGRVSDLSVIAIPLDLPRLERAEDPPESPNHPACAAFTHTDHCRESWQRHLARLKRRPETHWHKCDNGRSCAVVPVVYRDQCLAAVKLVCPKLIPEHLFESRSEILDILVSNFVTSEHDFLARLLSPEQVSTTSTAPAPHQTDTPPSTPPTNTHVLRAIAYVEKHFTDPTLTLGRIARELDIHPDYLSRLFTEHVGRRINRYISARRIETAKSLLETTDWQVKRIARETGHANAKWFSHLFKVQTSLSPLEYRRKARTPK